MLVHSPATIVAAELAEALAQVVVLEDVQRVVENRVKAIATGLVVVSALPVVEVPAQCHVQTHAISEHHKNNNNHNKSLNNKTYAKRT